MTGGRDCLSSSHSVFFHLLWRLTKVKEKRGRSYTLTDKNDLRVGPIFKTSLSLPVRQRSCLHIIFLPVEANLYSTVNEGKGRLAYSPRYKPRAIATEKRPRKRRTCMVSLSSEWCVQARRKRDVKNGTPHAHTISIRKLRMNGLSEPFGHSRTSHRSICSRRKKLPQFLQFCKLLWNGA